MKVSKFTKAAAFAATMACAIGIAVGPASASMETRHINQVQRFSRNGCTFEVQQGNVFGVIPYAKIRTTSPSYGARACIGYAKVVTKEYGAGESNVAVCSNDGWWDRPCSATNAEFAQSTELRWSTFSVAVYDTYALDPITGVWHYDKVWI